MQDTVAFWTLGAGLILERSRDRSRFGPFRGTALSVTMTSPAQPTQRSRRAGSLIPTERSAASPVPRLLDAMADLGRGRSRARGLALQDRALPDTITRLEATGSPVVADGEQAKPSFVTYPLAGIANIAPDGAVIPFADGHTRQLPRLTAGPFRYGPSRSASWGGAASRLPVKQAVIAASALSLLYPDAGSTATHARRSWTT